MPASPDPSPHHADAAPAPKRSLGRTLARVASVLLLLLIAALSVAGGVGYWMWQGEPEYWQTAQDFFQQTDSRELTEMAEAVENQTLNELSGGPVPNPDAFRDPNAMRELHLSYQRVNAWLARRLELWLANQNLAMPEAIEQPMITATEDGQLVLAFRARLPDWDPVMSVIFNVELLEDGRARLDWQRTYAGRLPLPSDWVREQVIDRIAAQAGASEHPAAMRALRDVLDGVPFDPLIPVDATREARVIDLNVAEAGVDLTVRIEARRATSAAAPRTHAPTP